MTTGFSCFCDVKSVLEISVVIASYPATILNCGIDKLEILGMFPPRTEAPTADKLALCYAPHVDMTTVIEVEVCLNYIIFNAFSKRKFCQLFD